MIRSDIWGPARVSNLNGTRWFVTFIDDHTRVCWVYLMKEKSEVCAIFQNFHKLVLNILQSSICILRTDNGREYFSYPFTQYLTTNGIFHQSTCPYTPQQNGVAERKNCYLLEVARSLMFTSSTPNRYWGEAILTAAYLSNRLPTKVLKYQTPLNNLMTTFPYVRILTTLTPKVFGCMVYVYQTSPNRHKLEPKSFKCIFIGYSPTQKEYKCYCPTSQKFYVSCDVIFDETIFYHTGTASLVEESHWDPTISMPITLPISSTTTYDSPTAVCSQPAMIEHNNSQPSAATSPISYHNPNELGEIDLREELSPEKQLKVYSRKPKNPAPQISQLLEPEIGPENEEKGTAASSDLDLPIAVRKGVRSCVKYPISNHLNYSKLSPQFRAFTVTMGKASIPSNIHEALSDTN